MSNTNLIVWSNVNWQLVRKRITRYQYRIFKASKKKKIYKVKSLQKFVIKSLDAKLLAVKHVTTKNKIFKTKNIDKINELSDIEKSLLVSKLKIDGKVNNIIRPFISKSLKSDIKSINISILKNKAKEYLVLLALEPEWETRFEQNLYSFRPGRNYCDAIKTVFDHLKLDIDKADLTKYILNINIINYLDKINKNYILEKLNTLPEIKKQVKGWLDIGIIEVYLNENNKYINNIFNKRYNQTIISPFLLNVALHGLEKYIKHYIFTKYKQIENTSISNFAFFKKHFEIIRYDNNLIIIHTTKFILEEVKVLLEYWLDKTCKLKLNKNKCLIVCLNNGFTFIGFRFINIIKNGKKLIKIYPEKYSIKSLTYKIGTITRTNRAISAYYLIKILRPIIIRWGEYYSICDCKETFSKVDSDIFGILRSWVFRRDRRNNREQIKKKYFPTNKIYVFKNIKHIDNWVFCGQKKLINNKIKYLYLPKLKWIKSINYIKICTNISIYDRNTHYWMSRIFKYGNFSPLQLKLLKIQKGKCNWCDRFILLNEFIKIDNIISSSKRTKFNYMILLHKNCYLEKKYLVTR